MRRTFNFLSGSVLGALVGAAIGLLLAPTSGEDLRGHVQERAQNIKTEVRQAAATRRSELEQQLAELRTPKQS